MDGGAWWATVHRVAKSQTRLSDFTFTFTFTIWKSTRLRRFHIGIPPNLQTSDNPDVVEIIQEYCKGFPGGAMVENPPAHTGDARDVGLIPGLGRSPEVGNGKPTPVFLPGKFHGQRSLVGSSPWGSKEWDVIKWLSTRTYTHAAKEKSQILFLNKYGINW